MAESRAAIAREAGQPLSIETIQVDGPREGEVMVEIKATGVCHTDAFTLSGADPEGLFPSVLGHEGAGVVVDTGPGVTSISTGDHVIPLYTPESSRNRRSSAARARVRAPVHVGHSGGAPWIPLLVTCRCVPVRVPHH